MSSPPLHCCRMCGATSYRRVLARDDQGAIQPTALYQCSGCSVVFADPKAWREGGADVAPPTLELTRLTPVGPTSSSVPFSPDFVPGGES